MPGIWPSQLAGWLHGIEELRGAAVEQPPTIAPIARSSEARTSFLGEVMMPE